MSMCDRIGKEENRALISLMNALNKTLVAKLIPGESLIDSFKHIFKVKTFPRLWQCGQLFDFLRQEPDAGFKGLTDHPGKDTLRF